LTLILITACSTSKNNFKGSVNNYQPVSKELFDTIARMDSLLFEAFNNCRIEEFTSLLTDDIEFYHDQSGLMLSSKTQSEGLKNRCSEQDKNGILRRELVKESLEVYPINNYGAVEIGVHNFYRTLVGQKEKLTTVAKFVNIWEKKNGRWKVSRIISYGHDEMNKSK
jgi:hypothetical protein